MIPYTVATLPARAARLTRKSSKVSPIYICVVRALPGINRPDLWIFISTSYKCFTAVSVSVSAEYVWHEKNHLWCAFIFSLSLSLPLKWRKIMPSSSLIFIKGKLHVERSRGLAVAARSNDAACVDTRVCALQLISKAAVTLCTCVLCGPGVKLVMLYVFLLNTDWQLQFNYNSIYTFCKLQKKKKKTRIKRVSVIQQVNDMHAFICWNGISAC